MWVHRTISEKIQAVTAHFPAIVLTGARQAGKTTLLRRLFPQHTYVSLDIPSLAANSPAMGPSDLAALIVRGGFPELWRDQEMPNDVYFGSYLATYLERDVRQIVNVASLRDFERCVRACAARSGQILNKSELAREVGVSLTAITSWLSVLEASGQISFLEPWFANLSKRLVKSPKLYFSDTGLLCYLLGITPQNLSTSPFVGAIFETFVFAELRKAARLSPRPVSLWFYRDKQQLEIDFLVLGGGDGKLVECKWTEHPDASDTKNLRRVARIVEDKPHPDFARTSSFVVARPHNEYLIDDQVRAVSVFEMPGVLDLVPEVTQTP